MNRWITKRFGRCKATGHNKEIISNTSVGVVRWCEKFRASRLHLFTPNFPFSKNKMMNILLLKSAPLDAWWSRLPPRWEFLFTLVILWQMCAFQSQSWTLPGDRSPNKVRDTRTKLHSVNFERTTCKMFWIYMSCSSLFFTKQFAEAKVNFSGIFMFRLRESNDAKRKFSWLTKEDAQFWMLNSWSWSPPPFLSFQPQRTDRTQAEVTSQLQVW